MIQLDVYTQVQIKQVLWYKILSTDNCTRFCILIIIQTMFTGDSHGDAGMSVTMRPSKDMVIVRYTIPLLVGWRPSPVENNQVDIHSSSPDCSTS